MNPAARFTDFTARLHDFIRRQSGPGNARDAIAASAGDEFNELALALFRLQFEANVPYRRICQARGVEPAAVSRWNEIPAVPTVAFKELEMTSLPPAERTTVFVSSGTTAETRSRHFHSTESLYDYECSLLPWFERHLLADLDRLVEEQLVGPLDKLPFLALTPPAELAPHSSLVHMLETVRRQFGSSDSLMAGSVEADGAWRLDFDRCLFAIRKSMCANRPVILLGPAFNFVQLLDYFAAHNMRYQLARGSRVMETGGYKGRSREMSKSALHALMTRHLGIPRTHIVTEYGMSELGSQAYDRVAGESGHAASGTPAADDRVFHFPPWARAQIISPESGRPVAEGETGLIRVYDLANVRSVLAVQTEDLGVQRGSDFELVGRAPQAPPRGCSLMAAEAIERPRSEQR